MRNGNGHFEGTLGHNTIQLETEREVAEFESAAGDSGLYTYKASPEEMQAISADPQALEDLMEKLAGERLVQWLELAEERLAGSGVRLFINCGNDDPFSLDKLIDDSAAATFLEGRVVPIDDSQVRREPRLRQPDAVGLPARRARERVGEPHGRDARALERRAGNADLQLPLPAV